MKQQSASSSLAGKRMRLGGLDAMRALAVIGMVYMHVSPTGWLEAAPFVDKPAVLASFEQAIAGRAMSLFVLMAGVSIALMTGGHAPHTESRLAVDRRRIAIRAGVLFLISLVVDQLSGMSLSILAHYSLWLLLLIPLLRLSPRTLFSAAAIAAALTPVFSFVVMNYGREWAISPLNSNGSTAFGLALLVRPQDWLAMVKQLLVGGGFQTPYAIPLLLAGLGIGRLNLTSGAVRWRLALTGGALVIVSWLVSRFALGPLGAEQALAEMMAANGPFQQPWQSLLTLPPHQLYAMSIPMAPYMLGIGLLMLTGLLVLLDQVAWQRILFPVTATGRLALTWYAAHQVFLQRAVEGPPYAFTIFAGMIVFALIFSPSWLRLVSRGPLEWLMHRTSVMVIPQERRHVTETATR